MSGGVKFVRINGRVVPLHGKGSAPDGASKRYGAKREITKPKQIGVQRGAQIGLIAGAFSKHAADFASNMKFTRGAVGPSIKNAFRKQNFNSKMLAGAAMGTVIGAAIGSMKFYRAGKGESDKQLAARISGKKTKSKLPKTGV
jgi:hypothetical protein